jgi:hypothetical protein
MHCPLQVVRVGEVCHNGDSMLELLGLHIQDKSNSSSHCYVAAAPFPSTCALQRMSEGPPSVYCENACKWQCIKTSKDVSLVQRNHVNLFLACLGKLQQEETSICRRTFSCQ